jgi:hypothetical protein
LFVRPLTALPGRQCRERLSQQRLIDAEAMGKLTVNQRLRQSP